MVKNQNNRQRIALHILEWHGGQDTGLYALGSSWFTKHEVPFNVVERAVSELIGIIRKDVPFPDTVTTATFKELKDLIAKIKRAVR